jgi:DNA-binding winged helix-turn-helix (wHTH) protein/tetratricopeptide (TPR) repeat protein
VSFAHPDRLVFDHGTIDLLDRRFLRSDGAPPVPLTPRDVDLLRYLAQWPDRLVGRDELLREVWGSPPDADPRMVDSAIRRLRAKIERDPSDARILVEVYGEGWRLALPTPLPVTTSPAAVPRPRNAFVGREPVLHRVAEELARTGFVVLVGPHGVGKTRVALEVAHRAEPASFVPLAGVRAVEEVRHIVASAIGAVRPGDESDEALIEQMVGRLLVLDDLEAEGAGDLVARWLVAPGLRILATRTEPFGTPEEVAISIAPLETSAARALYFARAEAAGRRPEADQQVDVDLLVARLAGNPLAIELAAAWAPLLDPAAVRAFVEEGPEDDPLQAAVRGAWRRLTAEEQGVLLACSLFPAVFDPTWVSSVADAPARVPGAIPALRRRALLVAAGKRLQVPHAVRAFLLAERERRGDAELVRRFGQWCAEEAERLGEAFVDPTEPGELLVELGTVVSSSHAVVEAEGRARVALALGPALDAAGWSAAHEAVLGRALAARPGPEWVGALLERRSSVLLALGDVARAETALAAAESTAHPDDRGEDDVLRAAMALGRAGLAGFYGDGEQVLEWTRHAAEVLRTKSRLDPRRTGPLWLAIGANLLAAHDRAGTGEAYLQAVAAAREAGSPRRAAAAFTRLASLAIEDGDVGLASARVGEAEAELRVAGLRASSALLRVRGALAELRGDYPLAEAEWREVAKLAAAHGEAWIEHEARLGLARAAIRRRAFDEAEDLLIAGVAFARGRWTAGWAEAMALLGLVSARRGAEIDARRIRADLVAAGAHEPAAFLERPSGDRAPVGSLPARLRWALVDDAG